VSVSSRSTGPNAGERPVRRFVSLGYVSMPEPFMTAVPTILEHTGRQTRDTPMPISTRSIAILNFLSDLIGLPSYERRETVSGFSLVCGEDRLFLKLIAMSAE
jgi:hypothetical protein